jgi:hypothetical protein
MTFNPAERALLSGDPDAADEFLDAGHCLVVDWRGTAEELLDDLARALAPQWALRSSVAETDAGGVRARVEFQGRVADIELPPAPMNVFRMLQRASALLAPEVELRLLRHTEGSDTHAFLLRPAAWWAAVRADHPERERQLFAGVEELTDLWDLDGVMPREAPAVRKRPWWRFW